MATVSKENFLGATSITYIINDDQKNEIENKMGTPKKTLTHDMQFFFEEGHTKGLQNINLDKLVDETEPYDLKRLHI